MNENAPSVFDNLPQLEESIPDDAKSSLVYIAAYVIRKWKTTVTDLEDASIFVLPTVRSMHQSSQSWRSYHLYGLRVPMGMFLLRNVQPSVGIR